MDEPIPVGAVVRPGSSRANKTGSWRWQRPVFKHVDCSGCRACELACPEGCVWGRDKHFDGDLEYCKGCGVCAAVCPRGDIEMQTEAGR